MKKILGFFLMLCFLLVFGGVLRAADEKVVASNYSDRYHVPSCKIAAKIRPEELVTYKSAAEAEAAGLAPCKKCHPKAVTSNLKATRSKTK